MAVAVRVVVAVVEVVVVMVGVGGDGLFNKWLFKVYTYIAPVRYWQGVNFDRAYSVAQCIKLCSALQYKPLRYCCDSELIVGLSSTPY